MSLEAMLAQMHFSPQSDGGIGFNAAGIILLLRIASRLPIPPSDCVLGASYEAF